MPVPQSPDFEQVDPGDSMHEPLLQVFEQQSESDEHPSEGI
jgi:hypothetical protein